MEARHNQYEQQRIRVSIVDHGGGQRDHISLRMESEIRSWMPYLLAPNATAIAQTD